MKCAFGVQLAQFLAAAIERERLTSTLKCGHVRQSVSAVVHWGRLPVSGAYLVSKILQIFSRFPVTSNLWTYVLSIKYK